MLGFNSEIESQLIRALYSSREKITTHRIYKNVSSDDVKSNELKQVTRDFENRVEVLLYMEQVFLEIPLLQLAYA